MDEVIQSSPRIIELDASRWQILDDFYDDLFAKLKSPSWHGRNFNALRDSIPETCTDSINGVVVPYKIILSGLSKATPEGRRIAADFEDLIRELAANGVDVAIETR